MTWEQVNRSGHRTDGRRVPHVSFYKQGRCGISAAALDLLGRPTHVVLHVDRDNDLLGLEPADDTDLNAYALRHVSADGGATASLTGFARQFAVKVGHYTAWLDEDTGFLVAKLEMEG